MYARAVCSIATRAELPQVRALARSLRTHDPLTRLFVLLIDDRHHDTEPASESFTLLRPSDLGVTRFEILAGIHGQRQLKQVVLPALVRHVLDAVAGPVVHLGVDALVFSSMDLLFRTAAGAGIVLVPRVRAWIPRDHLRNTDEETVKLGVFNQDCVAVAASPETIGFLRAWSDRLEHDRGDELPLASVRLLDLAAGFLETTRISLAPGLGVTRLNLHERALARHDGRLLAGGERLTTLHFDGLDGAEEPHGDPFAGPLDGGPPSAADRARTPQAAREAMQRNLVRLHPILAELLDDRQRILAACGSDDAARVEYGYERLADGTPLNRRLRRTIRDAELHAGLSDSPFSVLGTHWLLKWLNSPAERGATHGITRFWFGIYRERPDLQIVSPDLDGDGGPGFVRWARGPGRTEYAVPDVLLPAPPLPV